MNRWSKGCWFCKHSDNENERCEKDGECEYRDVIEIKEALDDFYNDLEAVMKKHGFKDIGQCHDNASMIKHFYNKEIDTLIIVEEQQEPDEEILEEFGIKRELAE